jgi:hypothetical protein
MCLEHNKELWLWQQPRSLVSQLSPHFFGIVGPQLHNCHHLDRLLANIVAGLILVDYLLITSRQITSKVYLGSASGTPEKL